MAAVSVSSKFEAEKLSWAVPIAALAVTVPVLLGSISGIEFTLAHLLLPFAALAILSSGSDRLGLAFIASGICGLLSIGAAHYLSAGNLIGNLAEIVFFMMAAPALLFVGRELPLKRVVFLGAVFSSSFLILATLPLLLTGEPVRAMYLYDTPGRIPGSEFINIHLFGLPVFATYGVNSIAPLFCIQAALLCGGIASTRGWVRFLFAVGLGCAVVLVVGSNQSEGRKRALRVEDFNQVSTGRLDLWRAAAAEVAESPIIGNGFAGFGRFSTPEMETGGNTTAHNYYLNLLWKGGVLFFAPFAAFVVMAISRAWAARDRSPQYFFAATAVAMTAFLPSLTWDILIVPSAGALAWFLLGSLSHNRRADINA